MTLDHPGDYHDVNLVAAGAERLAATFRQKATSI
jgi:hypothetical protein